ncbi:ATP-dependent Clp protease adaptor protein ClpS [Nitzschia inconspicua]|uniref:ATP-dependent Clp protease adaptor protein ClpS n=1 Tax=Nitzschia inconspicua TaxID=303405 RepID=A0A9K3K796_9STRA|nr:ATP-dependent Clp protease adaptor protein ClpS [Nitzschia inconspicua]KAG7340484.1 ATP-dependent Clp protease adaptor protein ClpS [Nitzschia inconspicua]
MVAYINSKFLHFVLALVVGLSLNIRDVSAFSFPTHLQHQHFFASKSDGIFNISPRQSTLLASTVIERPQEKEKVVEILDDKTVEEENKYGGDGWEIRLWNDPFNKREFVARCLSTICGKSDTESYQIMMQAHNNGMGVIGRYNLEIAEVYHNSLKENGLTVDMVQVDDE